MSLSPGIFHHKTASDLFGKLKRDYRALMNDPTDSDLHFNFFITAEHLAEWHNKKRANELRREHTILRICSQIANGAKHFGTDDLKHKSVVATHEPDVVTFDSSGQVSRPTSHFSMSLDTAEAEELGTSRISVEQLVSSLLQFWRTRLGGST